MNIGYFFVGAVTVAADREQISVLLDLCMRRSITYSDLCPYGEGYRFTLRYKEFSRLRSAARSEGAELNVIGEWGIPAILYRLRFRFGIPAGFALAVAMVILSGLFVWDIDVTGNERLTTSEVRELLATEGFFVGCYIPTANTDRIENRVMMGDNGISWMSINISGCRAEVQIREIVPAEDKETAEYPANLVAGKSGVVEEVRLFRGKCVVAAGKNVDAGDILVSGIVDSSLYGFRYTRASGQVLARTVTEFVVEIPYEYEAVRYTGAEYYDKYLNFFDYSINILKNSGNEGVFYDKIYIVENFCFPDGKETPFSLTTVKYSEYETVLATRTAEEASSLAYFELSRRLGALAESGIVIRKTVTPVLKEDSFMLVCSIVMIEDIAVTREFEVEISDKAEIPTE